MSLAAVKLDDKYELDASRIYLTGSQAFVRVLLAQRQRDLAAGLNTAGYISGYRGSPMTAIDQQLWRAGDQLKEHHVHFWPAVNEHMAMTSIWGTQQVGYFGDARYDGVFSMWYGKGPGLDQSLDALRQGNLHGSAKHGGVLVLAGDDPGMRSTVESFSSELLFQDLHMPVLYPADIQEVFDLGLTGIQLSRFCGLWTGFKCLPETIETAASIDGSIDRVEIAMPDFDFPPDGVNSRRGDWWHLQEARLWNFKVPAALEFIRANRLNRETWRSERPRFGIAALGKSWRDTLQALGDLGISESVAREIGISVFKVSVPWPSDDEGYRQFADGLEEVLVFEDKREQVEDGFRRACYGLPESRRPRISGRLGPDGEALVSKVGELTADDIARVIASRIAHFHDSAAVRDRIAFLDHQAAEKAAMPPMELQRLPYFCSGCPHNTSTRVPEGSRGVGGVGCHFMATWMDRDVYGYSQMGGEGVDWIGQAPFVETDHVFQQLGDGTYYHSGSIAIRAAIAAGVNITYKILYNDAVAMTGGQPVDGPISVAQITQQVSHEGVKRIAVVSDEPQKYRNHDPLAPGTTIHHRDDLEVVQRELREVKGVSVLVYDQTCAAEKRRRRKRGTFPDPAKRLFINDRVCEGCGDCSKKSNCVSVLPIDTEYGRKREIDQSNCNKDYSCAKGFCPSFVTVLGGDLRKGEGVGEIPPELQVIAEPQLPQIAADEAYGLLLAGTGGTGVVTVGAILGMAAHLDERGVAIVDQLGFAQKGGPVYTHVRLGKSPDSLNAVRINAGSADLVLGFDQLVAGADDALATMREGRTRAIVNSQQNFTGDFTRNPDLNYPGDNLRHRILAAGGSGNVEFINASRIATRLMGNSIAGNLFLVGYAWQQGLLPLSREALFRAIELNGVAAKWNQDAFEWGRRTAAFPEQVEALAFTGQKPAEEPKSREEQVARHARELQNYQNEAWARRYMELVERVTQAEDIKAPGKVGLAEAVARYAYKLMAYKDEYEVARLHSDPAFRRKLAATFDGDYKIVFNLAPPLLARKDKATGEPRKIAFGSWMMAVFGVLARLKFLRGTILDPFGWTAERRLERQLIEDYFELMEQIVDKLHAGNHALAVELANLPEQIRGYGHIKLENITQVKAREQKLLGRYENAIELVDAA